MLYKLFLCLLIGWVKLISPREYGEAIIGDLLESSEVDKLTLAQYAPLKLLWQVLISTPALILMRGRACYQSLNKYVLTILLVVGFSTLLLEQHLWGQLVWQLAQYWSIHAVFAIRSLYLFFSVMPIAVLCLALCFHAKSRSGLQTMFNEPVFLLCLISLCFSYGWYNLLSQFYVDVLVFRLIQVCAAYFIIKAAVRLGQRVSCSR